MTELDKKKQGKTCKDCTYYEPFDDKANNFKMFCKFFSLKMKTIDVCNTAFDIKIKQQKRIKYSIEHLYHFNCVSCSQWFSIGDFHLTKKYTDMKDSTIYCPLCGHEHKEWEMDHGKK